MHLCGAPFSDSKRPISRKKFAYLVALARAINALNSVSIALHDELPPSRIPPEAMRDRMNGNFFVLESSMRR